MKAVILHTLGVQVFYLGKGDFILRPTSGVVYADLAFDLSRVPEAVPIEGFLGALLVWSFDLISKSTYCR